MKKLLAKCWNDDNGALLATEFLLLATVLVFGSIVGLVSVRNAINAELTNLANAILALTPTFCFSGQSGCGAFVDGACVTTTAPPSIPCPVSTPPTFPVVIGCEFPCP